MVLAFPCFWRILRRRSERDSTVALNTRGNRSCRRSEALLQHRPWPTPRSCHFSRGNSSSPHPRPFAMCEPKNVRLRARHRSQIEPDWQQTYQTNTGSSLMRNNPDSRLCTRKLACSVDILYVLPVLQSGIALIERSPHTTITATAQGQANPPLAPDGIDCLAPTEIGSLSFRSGSAQPASLLEKRNSCDVLSCQCYLWKSHR
jgi:hypothetical protein